MEKKSMKSLQKLKKKFADAAARESEWIEEEPDAPLGRIAFAPQRSPELGVPAEKNTRAEDALLSTLSLHMTANYPPTAPQAKALKNIVSAGMYPKTFPRLPPGTMIYRGMSVGAMWLSKALGYEVTEPEGDERGTFVFRPRAPRVGSSWTTDRQVAESFSDAGLETHGVDPKVYAIVMTASAEDNAESFVDLSVIATLWGFEGLEGEAEVMGIGPIKVSRIEWTSMAGEDDY